MSVRVVFVGGSEFARHMLDELLKSDAEVCAVYSLEGECIGGTSDRRDLGDLAGARSIEHHTVSDLAEGVHVARLRELNPDLVLAMGDL